MTRLAGSTRRIPAKRGYKRGTGGSSHAKTLDPQSARAHESQTKSGNRKNGKRRDKIEGTETIAHVHTPHAQSQAGQTGRLRDDETTQASTVCRRRNKGETDDKG